MTAEQTVKLKQVYKATPGIGRGVLAKKAGVTENQARVFLRNSGKAGCGTMVVDKKGKSLADFRNTYDKSTIVPAKIRTAIKALGAGGWEYEVAFAKIAGASLSDIGMFRDKFADYIVSLKDSRRAWAGSASTAKAMREMI